MSMTWKCRKYRSLIDHSFEGPLDHASRQDLDHHLAGCQSCSHYEQASNKLVQYTLQWRGQQAQQGECEVPAGLNGRIMDAIRLESTGSESRRTTGVRPLAWSRYAGVAAALLLLFIGWQVFLPRMQNARAEHELAILDSAGHATVPASQETSNGQKAGDPTEKTAFGASNWQLFSGNFAQAMAPCINAGDTSSTTTTGGNATSTDTTSSSEAYLPTDAREYQDLLGLLDQAAAIRIYTRRLPVQQTLILAAFPAEDAARQYDQAKDDLASCTTPFRIEIIKIDDLPALIEGFSGSMLDQSIDSGLRSNGGLSWIMILMGA
jgi:hypothetical protein